MSISNFISLKQASAMTALYRQEKENILKPEYQGTNTLLLCETFDRVAFDAILQVAGCEKVRIYFGMKEDLQVRVIAVAANAAGEDILPVLLDTPATGGGSGVIAEDGMPCPEVCPPPSALNGG